MHRKRFLPLTLILIFSLTSASVSFAQINDTTGLHSKKAELDSAKKELKEAEAAVKKLQDEVNALKPIQKWKTGGFQSVNFNQVSLSNWSKGGQNSLSFTAMGNVYATYKYKRWEWENSLNLAYGLIQNVGEAIRKNEDKIDFATRVSRKVTNKLSWVSSLRFESQFAPGFDDQAPDTNRPIISMFMAPAYVKVSLGLQYQPVKTFSLFLAPVAGKFTIVMDEDIANRGIYIPASSPNDNFRGEFGALFSATYQNDEIIRNVGLRSNLELFNNYTDPNIPNRKNIDVDWQTTLNLKLGKFIGASLFTHLLYDNDTKYVEYNEEGTAIQRGARTQFKEVFGIGFSYKF